MVVLLSSSALARDKLSAPFPRLRSGERLCLSSFLLEILSISNAEPAKSKLDIAAEIFVTGSEDLPISKEVSVTASTLDALELASSGVRGLSSELTAP